MLKKKQENGPQKKLPAKKSAGPAVRGKQHQVASSFKHRRTAASKRTVQGKLKAGGQGQGRGRGQALERGKERIRKTAGQQRERRQWERVALVVAGLIGVALLANLLLRFLFAADKVICTVNQDESCPSLLLTKLEAVKGRALFFTNYQDLIAGLRSKNVDFDDFSYQKILPDRLELHFSFAPPVYQVVSAERNYYLTARGGFAQEGAEGLLVINDQAGKLGTELANYYLDDFFHQKMLELDYYWRKSGLELGEVDYQDWEQVVVRVGAQAYGLDLTSLDENWQKIVFIEQNYRPTDKKRGADTIIDVRFRLPVVR